LKRFRTGFKTRLVWHLTNFRVIMVIIGNIVMIIVMGIIVIIIIAVIVITMLIIVILVMVLQFYYSFIMGQF
jgi:hypothetical protein